MPYRQTQFFPFGYYHIFNRGSSGQDIFRYTDDYLKFLNKLEEYRERFQISVLCYSLLPDHFHLLVQQKHEYPISEFLQPLLVSYAMYFNRKYDNKGHVFQGPFKAKLVGEEENLTHLSRYIHLNPVSVLRLGERLSDYLWSSYPEYLGLKKTEVISLEKEPILRTFGSGTRYFDFVELKMEEEFSDEIKKILREVILE